MKKTMAFLLSLCLALCLGGCDIPLPGFVDYDVSGYIQALLDSSYHNSNERFMSVTGATAQAAAEYHTTTVENAAVSFCNAYGLHPSEEQMGQLQEVFSQVLQQAQYKVREEQKVDTGYYIEVEVTPITNFSDCSAQLRVLQDQAQQEADALNTPEPEPDEEDEDGGEDEDGWGDDSWGDEDEEEEAPIATPAPTPVPQVDVRELYLAKVVEFCRGQAGALSFGTARTMALDIRQTDAGELQLDLNQIDTLDSIVLPFAAG